MFQSLGNMVVAKVRIIQAIVNTARSLAAMVKSFVPILAHTGISTRAFVRKVKAFKTFIEASQIIVPSPGCTFLEYMKGFLKAGKFIPKLQLKISYERFVFSV